MSGMEWSGMERNGIEWPRNPGPTLYLLNQNVQGSDQSKRMWKKLHRFNSDMNPCFRSILASLSFLAVLGGMAPSSSHSPMFLKVWWAAHVQLGKGIHPWIPPWTFEPDPLGWFLAICIFSLPS